MSTRSLIGRMREDGEVDAIYCHFDGYPEGVGQTLLRHYGGAETERLLALGDISSLGAKPVSGPELWGDPRGLSRAAERGASPAYRDRGDAGTEARAYADDAEYEAGMPRCGAEYAYLLCGGEWLVSEGSGWKRLEDELKRK